LPVLRRRLRADLPHVDEERGAIGVRRKGREQPGKQQRLCVKGRYGCDYAAFDAGA
jgi:hypothetical protein